MASEKSIINKITIIFYLAGIGMLLLAGKLWFEMPDENTVQQSSGGVLSASYLAVQEEFDVVKLLSSKELIFIQDTLALDAEQLVALYVLTPDVCISCLTELEMYSGLLDEFGIAGKPVQQVVVVLGDDKAMSRRFILTTDVELPSAFYPSGTDGDMLLKFQGRELPGQLVFIDPSQNRIFMRIILSATYGASYDDRLEALFAAEEAHREL